MERRHQVFVSSTFSDLKDERGEVIQALLELDCIPAGMELFPATTENAWDLIKGVIDDSDYYCLVVGGRYGSVAEDGISFTEKEYDYAVAKGKPLMAYLHKQPDQIVSAKSESSDKGRESLATFRAKVEASHHCKYWSTAGELGGLVSRGLVNLRKAYPGEGWIRGRFAATDALLVEVANLRARVAELTAAQVSKSGAMDLSAIEGLASGADSFSASVSCIENGKNERQDIDATTTWDTILKYVGPALLNECTELEFADKVRLCFYHASERKSGKKLISSSVVVRIMTLDQIKIQLRALGQMVPGAKRRAVADKQTYWKLTDEGEKRLISAQALSKPLPVVSPLAGALAALTSMAPLVQEASVQPPSENGKL